MLRPLTRFFSAAEVALSALDTAAAPGATSADFGRWAQLQIDRWPPLVKAAGIQAE
jgi:hypothetical protein